MINIKDISATDLYNWINNKQDNKLFILDVRNDDELQKAKLNSAYHIPLYDIENRIQEIPKNKPIVCMCHHGMRSAKAAFILWQKGFDVYNLEGGINALSNIDSNIPKY